MIMILNNEREKRNKNVMRDALQKYCIQYKLYGRRLGGVHRILDQFIESQDLIGFLNADAKSITTTAVGV